MLPDGWKYLTVNDLAVFANGKPHEKELCNDGKYVLVNSKYISSNGEIYKKTNLPSCLAAKNDILMVMSDVPNGRAIAKCFLVDENKKYAVNQRIAKLTPRDTHPIFLYYSINRNPYYLSFDDGLKQTNLRKDEVLDCPILTPPLPEQKKIAAILSTWDCAIEGTEKLLANSQQQKKALMQQLLTGKKRLPGFTGEWKLSPISAFIKESRVPGNSGDIAKKITIKLYGKGVFPKEEKREGSESTKYYKRKSGQFIYSKLDFLNGAFGIIPSSLDGYESTLDLPAFDFLHNVSSQWFIFYVSREEFYSANLGLANGGRKARRVNPSDLLRISVPTPPLPEQQAIATVLTTADAEITALEADLARLRQEKKALMQQLLTGKRRVKVD